jgi:hypothetical protein
MLTDIVRGLSVPIGPQIPEVSQVAIDLASDYCFGPHQAQNLELMQMRLLAEQPVLANYFLLSLDDFADEWRQAGQTEENFAALRREVLQWFVFSWYALYKQEELDREIIEGD